MQITFEHKSVSLEDVLSPSLDLDLFSKYELEVIGLIRSWYSDRSFSVKTSGSTGSPKTINFAKERLELSAQRTIDFFGLNHTDTAALSIDVRFIGGMMMVFRALLTEMDLIIRMPQSDPLDALMGTKPTFISVVPLQLRAISDKYSVYKSQFNDIKAMIVGGGTIDDQLEEECQKIDFPIYQTFGMTETASHVACRRINGPMRSVFYELLPGWSISTNDSDQLMIKWHDDDPNWLTSNDIIKLKGPNQFKWLGRSDNVINSGGIKLHPEAIEKEIEPILNEMNIKNRFFVGGVPDRVLGSKAVLFLETDNQTDNEAIYDELKSKLPDYHAPREIIFVSQLLETENGKINRQANVDRFYRSK